MSDNLLREHGLKDEYVAIIREILGVEELTLNPMQVNFIANGFLEKNKVVISAPPASGKTLLVHLKYAKNLENGKKRMIYLLPFIRIRKELLRKMAVWEKVGVISTDDYKVYEEGKAQIFVATYASIDYLLLRGKKPTSDFFVFDEIDMVTDDLQGTRTESSISRIIRESEVPTLFALSATIGSPELIESWLGCSMFTSNYRPGIGFKREVKQPPPEKEQVEVIEEIFHSPENKEEPMLVFYYNTARCRKKAVELTEHRASASLGKTSDDISGGIKEIIRKCDITSEVNDQIKCLRHGVAFYFARLQPQCKEVIERLFENNLLDVVFATPALARGINMPVRTVLIPSPYKFSPFSGNVLLSRAEIEQMFGRACRPPFQDRGFGIVFSTNESRTKQLNEKIHGALEKMSSNFLQSSPRKGRTLSKFKLAIEVLKEARMQNRSETQLTKQFDSYLFMQEIKDKDGFYKFLRTDIIAILMKVDLLDKNIDGEIITPEVVDIVIDYGIGDLNRMVSLINLSRDIIDDKLEIFSGHILNDILCTICKTYGSFGIATIKEKYDPQKIKKYFTERTQIEPTKIDKEHHIFTALDQYSAGVSLEKIEAEFGLQPDSIPYIATRVVSRDLALLKELVRNQCMGDRNKMKFCDYLEMCANITRRGVPYLVLPFVELIDRLGRKAALNILKKYGSAPTLLKLLGDEQRTTNEFRTIDGIGRTLSQRIINKRKELISNLQKKITLWGDFSS